MSKHIYPEDGIRIVTSDEACNNSLVIHLKVDDQTSTSLKHINDVLMPLSKNMKRMANDREVVEWRKITSIGTK